jgi:hypothetical protein
MASQVCLHFLRNRVLIPVHITIHLLQPSQQPLALHATAPLPHPLSPPLPCRRLGEGELGCSDIARFQCDLEFVQCLANPNYVNCKWVLVHLYTCVSACTCARLCLHRSTHRSLPQKCRASAVWQAARPRILGVPSIFGVLAAARVRALHYVSAVVVLMYVWVINHYNDAHVNCAPFSRLPHLQISSLPVFLGGASIQRVSSSNIVARIQRHGAQPAVFPLAACPRVTLWLHLRKRGRSNRAEWERRDATTPTCWQHLNPLID